MGGKTRVAVGLAVVASALGMTGCLAPDISESSFRGADGRPINVITSVAEFDRGVLGGAGPQVVVFYSPTCPHCGGLIRKLPEVVAQNPGVDFCVVNVYDLPDLGAREGVTGVPTTIGYHHGREFGRFTGNRSAKSFGNWLHGGARGRQQPPPRGRR